MKSPDFDELVGPDVPEAERERLRRAHDLLVAAGPPPDLPESLASPPVRMLTRRRVAALLLAAALSLAAFGAGWLLADRSDESFEVRRAVEMHATANAPGAWGQIELGYPDAQGNWQIFYKLTPSPAYDFQSFSADSPKRVLKTKRPGVKLVCKFAASEVITLFPG